MLFHFDNLRSAIDREDQTKQQAGSILPRYYTMDSRQIDG